MGWGLMGGREPPVGMRGAIERPKGECPPRSGSVQRDCIRQAGIGLGEGDARTGPPDTTFVIFISSFHYSSSQKRFERGQEVLAARPAGYPWPEQMDRKKSRKVRETRSPSSQKRSERDSKC